MMTIFRPFAVPPGGERTLSLVWTDPLDEGRYNIALTIWKGGESLAQATSSVAVLGGQITELAVPEEVAPGEKARLTSPGPLLALAATCIPSRQW